MMVQQALQHHLLQDFLPNLLRRLFLVFQVFLLHLLYLLYPLHRQPHGPLGSERGQG
jgi:hypothetical protein